MQLEDEEYYFKISPASDIADGSPNTAHGKTAKSTSGETAGAAARDTVVATVSTVRKIGHRTTKRARRDRRMRHAI